MKTYLQAMNVLNAAVLFLEAAATGKNEALVTNDAIVVGLLLIILAVVFVTANSTRPFFKTFYKYVRRCCCVTSCPRCSPASVS